MQEAQLLIERGKRAEHLLQDEIFNAVILDCERQLVNNILGSEPHEAKKREGLFQTHQGLKAVMEMLNAYVSDGVQAEQAIS